MSAHLPSTIGLELIVFSFNKLLLITHFNLLIILAIIGWIRFQKNDSAYLTFLIFIWTSTIIGISMLKLWWKAAIFIKTPSYHLSRIHNNVYVFVTIASLVAYGIHRSNSSVQTWWIFFVYHEFSFQSCWCIFLMDASQTAICLTVLILVSF